MRYLNKKELKARGWTATSLKTMLHAENELDVEINGERCYNLDLVEYLEFKNSDYFKDRIKEIKKKADQKPTIFYWCCRSDI